MNTDSSRMGGAATTILIVLLLVVVGFLAWFAMARQAPPPSPQSVTQSQPVVTSPPQVVTNPVLRGKVTAVRQASGLPTYILTDLGGGKGVKPGDHLSLVRNGATVALLQVETVTDDGAGSACRILPESWAPGAATDVVVAEPIEKR